MGLRFRKIKRLWNVSCDRCNKRATISMGKAKNMTVLCPDHVDEYCDALEKVIHRLEREEYENGLSSKLGDTQRVDDLLDNNSSNKSN